MKKLRFLVSLTTNDNDYQIEQAQSAEQMARKLGAEVQIVYADNDAITQSTQILKAIQVAEDKRPDAVVFEPVGGTALPQVARAAASVGIGWAVLNRDASYIPEMRKSSSAPIFEVSSDHLENGGGRRLAHLRNVAGIAIQHGPSDTDGCGRAGDLGQSCATDGLKNNGVRPLILGNLNGFQDLGALGNRVVIRINDLDFRAQFAGHLLRGLRLFDLVIVVVGRKGNQKSQLFHGSSKSLIEPHANHTSGSDATKREVNKCFSRANASRRISYSFGREELCAIHGKEG